MKYIACLVQKFITVFILKRTGIITGYDAGAYKVSNKIFLILHFKGFLLYLSPVLKMVNN